MSNSYEELTQAIAETNRRNEELTTAINSSFLLICAFLVFFMQSGFAMLESGNVTKKHTMNILLKNVLDTGVGSMLYWAVGFAFAFGDATKNGFIGAGNFFLLGIPSNKFGHEFVFFQFAFAATATTIVSGAIAERMKFQGYVSHAVMMIGFVVPVVSHWVWSEYGWLNANNSDAILGIGVLDFAGGGVVHVVGGFSAVVAAKFTGYRNQYATEEEISNKKFKPRFEQLKSGKWIINDLPASSPVLATLGVFILWFGWYGFNCGSVITVVGNTDVMALVAVNTTIAAGSAAITSLTIGRIERRNQLGSQYSLSDATNGILAGLVSVTGPCAFVPVWASLLIGMIGAVLFKIVSALLLHPRVRIDDPVDAFAVHGACGAWGLLAAAIFAKPSLTSDALGIESAEGGLLYGDGKRLGAQIVAIFAIAAWSITWTCISFGLMTLIDRRRGEDTLFLERSSKTQTLGFGYSDSSKQTVGFFNPDVEKLQMEMTDWVISTDPVPPSTGRSIGLTTEDSNTEKKST